MKIICVMKVSQILIDYQIVKGIVRNKRKNEMKRLISKRSSLVK